MAEEITHTSLAAPAIKAGRPIQLMLTRYGDTFHVTAVVNTTYYRPGDIMTREVVEMCCQLDNWTVQMVDNQILSSVLAWIRGR